MSETDKRTRPSRAAQGKRRGGAAKSVEEQPAKGLDAAAMKQLRENLKRKYH
jgi:hypothetical protein